MADAGRTLAVLGAGKAAEALISGVISSGWRDPGEIVATARHQERLDELAERHGVRTTLCERRGRPGRRHRRHRRQAAGHRRAAGGHRRLGHAGADGRLDRRRDPDGADRAAPGRRGAGRPRHAEHADDGPRRHGRHLRRRPRRRGAPRAGGGGALERRARRARRRAVHGRDHRGLRLGPRLLRAARRVHDRGRDPARPLARDLDRPRRPDDAGDGEAPPGRGHAPGRAARGGHLAGRDDDRRHPRAGAGRRARRVPERDPGRDGAVEGAGAG